MSMLTVLEILKRSADFLAKHGVENPRLNAELLLGHALGLKRMQLYLQFERPLAEPELAKLRPLVKRRSEREPVQYIIGTTEFAGVTLKVDSRALIPRPETELLVEIAREFCAAGPTRVLDLGTGSGAIALALVSSHPELRLTAVDVSADALALAHENAVALKLTERVCFVKSDWFAQLPVDGEPFQLIVGNPPYLTDDELGETAPEVRKFEPRNALTSGPHGLDAIERIVREAPAHLGAGGRLLIETGISQHAEITRLAGECGYAQVESRRDLAGRDRFILATAQALRND